MSTYTSTAFDLSDFDTPMNGADDLINSLTPSLLNNKDLFQQHHHHQQNVGDSPDSYISGSSEETSNSSNPNIEDFDLYDFGASTGCDFIASSGEPFKFSGTNQQSDTTTSVDDFFKSYGMQDAVTPVQQQLKGTSKEDKLTLKSSTPTAIQSPQVAFPTQHVITPQQIQEQFLLLQQQQRAHLAQQQFAFSAAAAAQMPFGNPFMNPYAAAHIPTFMPPAATSPSPISHMQLSPKESSSTTSSVKHESPKKKTTQKKKTSSTTSSTTSSNSSATSTATSASTTTGTKRAREANNKSPSEALAELDAKKSSGSEDDKEIKRQRRLIKNRESAQASRERKKLYVKGLEAKVEELTSKNSDITSKLQELEEENRRLRDRLTYLDPTGLHLQDVLNVSDEPDSKKRRLSKLPMPRQQQQAFSYNPFDAGFWAAFLGGNSAPATQPTQQEIMAQQARMAWQPMQQSKRVVMFIMLFCVAVMLVLPKDNLQTSLTSTVQNNAGANTDETLKAPVTVDVKRMGRRFLQLQEIYDTFGKVQSDATLANSDLLFEDFDASKLSVEMDHSTQSLIISFPMDSMNKNVTVPSDIKIKKEEEQDGTCPADSKTEIHVGQTAMEMLKQLCSNYVNS